MKLEINDKHKKIDFKSINKNALKAKVLSSLLAVTLFTGCTNQISKNNTDSINDTTIEKMDEAILCAESENTLDMMTCTEHIKSLNLPLLQRRDPKVNLKEGYKWNYSPLVDSYYPKGYLDEEIMWDMTKKNYAYDVY